MVILGIAVQTSFFNWYPLYYFQPDLVLTVVVWCALQRSFTEGGILTLFLAQIAETHSGSPKGLYLMMYMGIYLLVRVLSRVIMLESLNARVGLTMIAALTLK